MRAALPDVLQQQIQLGGGLSQAEWIATMESADVALVTMVPGSETVVMPSKTYSAMMAGQAILAIAPEDWAKSKAPNAKYKDLGSVVSLLADPLKSAAEGHFEGIFRDRLVTRSWGF